jgi:hypothetical protein
MDYQVEIVRGEGMNLSDCRVRPTVRAVVKHTDGTFCWGTTTYFSTGENRQVAGLRMNAAKMAKRYQAHLDSTGERFEVIEKAKREAAAAAKKKADRIKWLEQAIPKYQAELAQLKAEA